MFTWRLLLRIAFFRMLNSTQAEPEHRSAINRAYYAALGEAREYAKNARVVNGEPAVIA